MRTDSLSATAALRNRRDFLKFASGALSLATLCGNRSLSAETRIAARIEDAPQSHVLLPALRRTSEALKSFESVKDYQATLVREELIGDSLMKSRMELKLRHDPFSVYLKAVEPNAGREVIYIEGQNDGNLLAHETGFKSLVGTLSLDPTGNLAMKENRHPVTKIGIRKMGTTLLEKWLAMTQRDDVKVNFYPSAKIGDLPCQVYESSLAKQNKDDQFQSTRVYFDASTGFPVRAQSFAFPKKSGEKPQVIEDYFYMNLATNVGLKNIDFDTSNPAYNF